MLLKTSLRSFFAHKGRMALSLVAVVLSVAFVSGTLVFSNTATSTFDSLFASTASDVSVGPAEPELGGKDTRAQTLTVTVDSVRKVAAVPGVKTAIGQVTVENATLADPATFKKVGPTTGAPTIVGNWVDTPRSPVEITSGHAPQGPDQVVLDADTAKKARLGLGGKLRVIINDNHDFTIVGIAAFKTTNPGAALAFLDTATAQSVLLGGPAYTSVEVYGDGSRSDEQLKSDALAGLGAGFEAKTAAEQKADGQKSVGSFLDFMKYAMLGFAGISLLVGGFLIINTFSMLVAQRTREIGLLRAVGGSRKQVNRSVLVEALLLGLAGSTIGIAAGLGLAVGLIQLMNAAGMHLDASDLKIGADVFVAGYAVGVVITVLAAWIPARRASRISPIAALRDHGTPAEARSNTVRAIIGLVLTAGGGGLLVLAAKAEKAATGGQFIGLGVLLTLVGFVVLGPLLATTVVRVLGALLPTLFGPSGRLAQRNAMRNPRRTGATAAALMIGLALVIGASVFTSSVIESTNNQIDRSVGADYIITAGQNGVSPAVVAAVRQVQGIDHVTEQKSIAAYLTAPDGKTEKTRISAVTERFTEDFRLPVKEGAPDSLKQGAVAIGEDYAKDHGLKAGDTLKVDYGNGRVQSVSVGVVMTKGNQLFDGNTFASLDTVTKVVPAAEQPVDDVLFGKAAAGADVARTLTGLEDALKQYPQASVRDQAGYKDLVQEQVNTLLYMIYGLLGLAIVVAVLGVVNTLALSVVERTREIGLLRAIGLSRRQLRRMIRLESVVIALFGAVLGTALGLAWGITGQQVLRTQGLETLAVPTTTILLTLAASVVIGLLAALVPAFRAGRMNVLAAIATD
ncbi:ABC transporter permease [Kitasatospora purpeofusca]|uniref:ABC transporter permease n=1 Tax=Kitasatospora purpeofusca TaxID=67352 RepID=UPI002256D9F1|nr:FtsX-like permease family protein [Kitasatospora purpeofusca]MCX4753106.1 FtsX-like permease family protein [Kitasatospora purpeofusca]WSR32634.1 FtsX-like permease family protein [Kitasatospora purpeofusca]